MNQSSILVAQSVSPQSSAELATAGHVLTEQQPSYYLLQALSAVSPSQRRALWHIGMEVSSEENNHVVSSLLHRYPAEVAGLRRGDRLLTANGAPFHPVFSFNGSDKAAPSPGSPVINVELEISRDNQLLRLTVQPVHENLYDSQRSAFLNSVQQFSAGNKTIAYAHPWILSRNLNDLLSYVRVIENFARSDGLILDLRDSFGFLSSQHLRAFLPAGRSLFSITGPGNVHTRLDAGASSLVARNYGKPIAVLINAGTTGGAELLAYELAKLDRVTTIGEATAGLLGDYTVVNADSGSGFVYQAPENSSIDGIPMETFKLQPKLDSAFPLNATSRNDPQFEAAFNVLLGRI